MRIIITQAEIEEAIADKVLSQMSINDNCELKINLQATRGEEGYTATIDVVEKAEEEPIKVPARRGRAAAPKAAEPVQETAPATVTSDDAQDSSEDASATDQTDTTEDAPVAPRTGSIFAGLKKPSNEPAEV